MMCKKKNTSLLLLMMLSFGLFWAELLTEIFAKTLNNFIPCTPPPSCMDMQCILEGGLPCHIVYSRAFMYAMILVFLGSLILMLLSCIKKHKKTKGPRC